jgi:hypothetical protein
MGRTVDAPPVAALPFETGQAMLAVGGGMSDESARLDLVRRYWEYAGADVERAQEIYHDDAVLEFPQSGERFEGVDVFTEWRRQYPGDVSYRVRRVTAGDDLVVAEVSVSYDGSTWMYGVQLLEFRADKVARERIFVMDGWEAPQWRARWRAEMPADPPG